METIFAPSNVSISHFAPILGNFENFEFFDIFEKIIKNVAFWKMCNIQQSLGKPNFELWIWFGVQNEAEEPYFPNIWKIGPVEISGPTEISTKNVSFRAIFRNFIFLIEISAGLEISTGPIFQIFGKYDSSASFCTPNQLHNSKIRDSQLRCL